MEFSKPILSTCNLCRDVVGNTIILAIEDLRRSAERGCGFCRLLSLGLERLKCEMPETLCAAFGRFTHIRLDQSTTDTHFKFFLESAYNQYSALKRPQFEAFLIRNEETSHLILPYNLPQEVPQRLDIPRVVSMINKWMAGCDRYHDQCSLSPNAYLPKRVLSISPVEDGPVKLVELSGVQESYIALSYSWGSMGMNLRTTSDTLPSHLHEIPFSDFPKLFQDVVAICRALSVQYLWIDALCIIQDSTEDWEIQSSQMARIYSDSLLTIAASSCANTDETLFSDRWTNSSTLFGDHCRLGIQSVAVESEGYNFCMRPFIDLAHARFSELDNAKMHFTDAPLMTRAWAYQERLLPPRTLHFHAEELVWECKTGVRCECGSLDEDDLRKAEYYNLENAEIILNSGAWLKSLASQVENPEISHDILSSIWMDLVSEYSGLILTYEKDRLAALSGLAAKFTNTSLGEYLAGIWTNMLPVGLLWVTVRLDESHFPQRDVYQPSAPSWSWASVPLSGRNEILYTSNLAEVSPEFKVLQIKGEVIGKNPFGWVKNSVLSVGGSCIRCVVFRTDEGVLSLRNSSETSYSVPIGPHLMDFYMDRPETYKSHINALLLYLGSYFGIVLQQSDECKEEPSAYRRIGLAQWTNSAEEWDNGWISESEVQEVNIL